MCWQEGQLVPRGYSVTATNQGLQGIITPLPPDHGRKNELVCQRANILFTIRNTTTTENRLCQLSKPGLPLFTQFWRLADDICFPEGHLCMCLSAELQGSLSFSATGNVLLDLDQAYVSQRSTPGGLLRRSVNFCFQSPLSPPCPSRVPVLKNWLD